MRAHVWILLLAACGGKDETDADGDGVPAGQDCDDSDPDISPEQSESPYDGIDNDCDPSTPDDDLDADGLSLAQDCDDLDAQKGGAEVIYDGIDNDCDLNTPDDDLDADGWAIAEDCDDNDPSLSPGAEELPRDGIDNDCDLAIDCEDPDLPTETWEGDLDASGIAGFCDRHCARPIAGSLTIATSGLSDLDGLECVTAVGDYVVVNGNFGLFSLSGLDNLQQIEGDLYIIGNPLLSDIAALQQLSFVGGDVEITGNPSLGGDVAEALFEDVEVGGTLEISDNG